MTNTDKLKFTADAMVDEFSHDELFDFVVAIDAAVGRWQFTDRLVEHFDGLGKVHSIEQALDVANSERADIADDASDARLRS